MTIQIKNRWTGVVLRTVEAADLRDANLRDADLRGADLYGANLRYANLRGANLYGANLRDADLRDADLRDANLRDANLGGANLGGANLSDANLGGANLGGANLSGVAEQLGIEIDLALPAQILAQITAHPETHQQDVWHSSCGTRHCVAGWVTHLSGRLGRALDSMLGTPTAATLLLWRPGVVLPSFEADATEDETLGRLRAMADAVAGSAAEPKA